jgi:type II restriction enzyme
VTQTMDLSFQATLGSSYKSPSQRVKKLSEHWVGEHIYCPNCGHINMTQFANNRPVADFFCTVCREEFELKCHAARLGNRVVDGAYRTMIERLRSATNPNLLLLRYDRVASSVTDLLVIPKYFFIPEIIVKKRALAPSAKRAGWIGCFIAVQLIPEAGRIYMIRNGIVGQRDQVLAKWKRTLFLVEPRDLVSKSSLISIMRRIEKIRKQAFTIDEMYRFEDDLRLLYPSNQHIRPKIRQQLQVLRDQGYLEFVGRGTYRPTAATAI